MSSPDDVVFLSGTAGMFARRAVRDAWVEAGSPPVNSATRLKAEQEYFWNGWANRLPGFNPADNPNDPNQALAHVRGVALDIDPTPSRVAKLEAAGLVRPYSYEPWHYQLPGDVRRFPLITRAPSTDVALDSPIILEDDDMTFRIITSPAYQAANQVVIMGEGRCETVPRGFVINMISHGGVRENFYPQNAMLEAEVRNFYMLKDLSDAERAEKTQKVVSEVFTKFGK